MLKIHRPLCSDLTFRLTHDISPDLFLDGEDYDSDLNREQFIYSCLKQKEAFADKVKDKYLDNVKDTIPDNRISEKECYIDNNNDLQESCITCSDAEKLSSFELINQKTIEHLNNVINEQYHASPERRRKRSNGNNTVENTTHAVRLPSKEEKEQETAGVSTCHNSVTKTPRKPRKLPEIPKNQTKYEDVEGITVNISPPVPIKCLADELQEALIREHKDESDDDVFLPSTSCDSQISVGVKPSSSVKVYPKFSGNYWEELKKLHNSFNCVSKNTRPYLTSNNLYLSEDSVDEKQQHLSVASGGRRRRNSSGDSSRRKSTSSVASTLYQDLEVTHRGMHRFIPRHKDEMTVEIGDPIHVFSEADDLWCEGVNLRTFQRGIFPSMYATDLQFLEEDDSEEDGVSRFSMQFLGSVEVNEHKGDDVLCQAINKVALSRRSAKSSTPPPMCTVEVSQYGIRMLDKSKSGHESEAYTHFFALKNISFCGFHPRNERYFGFITKHPKSYRFASHVFLGTKSTRSVSDALGKAFKRFYQEYMAFTHPTEDIYME